MDKLELKHLAPYLPYKLQWCFEGEDFSHEVIGFELNTVHLLSPYNDYGRCTIDEGNPILRPLSDLTKEISDNKGRKFIPAKLLWSVSENDEDNFDTYGSLPSYWTVNIRMLKSDYRNIDYGDIEKLLEWHFDIFGLIDSGLAIDINTLNK